jgi:hypothetical protein
VDDEFIKSLFDIIEDLSYDASDPYHYPVIRVLVSKPCILALELLFGGPYSFPAVGLKRAIHDLSTRPCRREVFGSIDKQGYQGPVSARESL